MTYVAYFLGALGGFLLGAVVPSPIFWIAVLIALVVWRKRRAGA